MKIINKKMKIINKNMKKLIKKMKIINLKLRKLMLFTISDIIIYKNEKINKFKISQKK
jgi:hypothetical protein